MCMFKRVWDHGLLYLCLVWQISLLCKYRFTLPIFRSGITQLFTLRLSCMFINKVLNKIIDQTYRVYYEKFRPIKFQWLYIASTSDHLWMFRNFCFLFLFSYGLLFGIGNAMVRETSTLMLSQYFKRKRELVEMYASLGTGLGIAIFTNGFQAGIEWVKMRS